MMDSDSDSSTLSSSIHHHETRALTYLNVNDDAYINTYDEGTDTILLTAYALLTICFCLVAYFTIRVVNKTREFAEWKVIHVGLPAISMFMALECATLAVDESISKINKYWAGILYALEALVAPGLFLSTFVIVFLAYRIRSMPFCCVRRRPHGDDPEATSSSAEPLVQPAILVIGMNVFAIGLTVLSILVHFDVMWSSSDLAGRTGWMTVFTEPWEPAMVHVVLALIPMTLISLICFYFTGLLFRYGNEISITITSSCFNAWLLPPIGCFFLLAAQFPRYYFPVWSNLGILLYQVSILCVLFAVRGDLGEAVELGTYLSACWEVPAGFGETTTSSSAQDPVVESSSPKSRTGILRTSASSKTEEQTNDPPKVLDSTLL